MKQTFTRTNITTSVNTVESIEVADKLFAFKLSEETSSNVRGVKPFASVTQGITNDDGIRDLRAGRDPKYNPNFFVASDEFLEALRRFGYQALFDAGFKPLKENAVFDHFEAGGSTDAIIRLDGDTNVFWRMDGTVADFAFELDYISDHMDNLHYDLNKVVELLWDRDDIIFVDDQLPHPVENPKEAILRVPHYNAGGGRNSCVRFFWRPTREQLAALCHSTKAITRRHATIFDKDMLGLRKGGAAKYGSFFEP